ncbi:uncharacterized protein LOC111112170 [Crassostrea virginica]
MYGLCILFGILILCRAYENIALEKQVYQRYPYAYIKMANLTSADKAVDGFKSNLSVWGGQCVISGNYKQTATWWVNLTRILSIHHVTIYYRTGNVAWGPENHFADRFLGFSLYVSNTTDKLEGTLCYKDTEFNRSTIPAVFNTTCPLHGQYVIYYNERLDGVTYPKEYSKYAYNEICELEVFGCPKPGYYGVNCSTPCPDPNCRYCHIETGACQGCRPGYQGHRCETACTTGYFGDGCVNSCINTCTGCNNVHGLCDKGCHSGWKGDYCLQPCLYGFYGQRCEQQCNVTCTGCNNTNGVCDNGCKPGWEGTFCEQACVHGYFGQNCKQPCNATCIGCNKENGICDKGCLPGWKGNYCDEKCDNGTFGDNCLFDCGHCLNSESCVHTNGSCVGGCQPGFRGDQCTEECELGYYGPRCLKDCSAFCKSSRECNHITGFCKMGCKQGWQGNDCLEVSKEEESGVDWKLGFYIQLSILCSTFTLLLLYVFCSRCRQFNDEGNQHVKENETFESGRMSFKFDNSAYEEYKNPIKQNDTELYLDVQ